MAALKYTQLVQSPYGKAKGKANRQGGVNTRLPDDIVVTRAVEVSEEFNAISSCRQKEYTYRMTYHLLQTFLQGFFHTYGIFLDLPTMVGGANIHQL